MDEIKVPKKANKYENKDQDKKTRIDDETGFWLNKTKSGKGIVIVIGNQAFISSLANLKELINGNRKGVKFSLLVPSED